MSHETTLYDAFTGMSPAEKSAVLGFLYDHTENANRQNIREALEYAIKNKPSFGGFILAAQEGKRIIAAIVANRTGMEGYNPKHLFVYVTFHEDYRENETFIKELLHRAIEYAEGDVAFHIEPKNPALKIFKKIGFQAQYLELRFSRQAAALTAGC